jgi:hypothetical protein
MMMWQVVLTGRDQLQPVRGRRDKMPTAEQCRAYAAQHKMLAANSKNSARRTTVLLSISKSWTALANQLDTLSVIVKHEGM